MGAVEGGGDGRDAVAIGGEAASWFANIGPRQFAGAVFLLGESEAGDGAGDAAGAPAHGGGAGTGFEDVAIGAEIHVAAGGGGGGLAVVDGDGATVGEVDHHEAAAADVSGERIDDGEGEADGDARVHGVTAFFENFHTGFGREIVNGCDHAMLGLNRRPLGESARSRCQNEGERGDEVECDDGGAVAFHSGWSERMSCRSAAQGPRRMGLPLLPCNPIVTTVGGV